MAFQFRGRGTQRQCGYMYACMCDRFAKSHTRFCTTERNDRFYVCSGLSRDALAIILNAQLDLPLSGISGRRRRRCKGGGESVLITLSVYRILRKLISVVTSSFAPLSEYRMHTHGLLCTHQNLRMFLRSKTKTCRFDPSVR